MVNKGFTIRCGLNTPQFNPTQRNPNQLNSTSRNPNQLNATQPDSTQLNPIQHNTTQFKSAQRILGSRSTALKKSTTDLFGARGEVRCQVTSLPVFNRQKPEFESPDPNSSLEQQRILYTTRKQVLADKFDRIQLCVKELEVAYDTWLKYIQTITAMKKREEKAYECVTKGEHGLFRIMHEEKEALITLTRYKDDAEQRLEQLFKGKCKEQERSIPPSNLTVNPPQLSLPTFSGDATQWRQFWSSFNAAVHSQTIPEIQKLNYLFSCLGGNALQVVSGYEITPENYELGDYLETNIETPRQ
uniref:Uncharacterized protein n=1 Tax=Loa loa TaxID=7209 RepID=A0A1I7VNL6_LOALO